MGKTEFIRVFVYGTLKPGGFYYAQYCEGRVVESVEAIALGTLYDLPLGYPAMTVGDRPVHGYILSFQDPQVLVNLDELEGYQRDRPPEANEYTREWVPVFDVHQEPLGHAWIYLMSQHSVQQLGGTLLPDGRWHANQKLHQAGKSRPMEL